MKKDIHPKNFRDVAFFDASSEKVFIIGSTVNTKETMTVEGKEYPMFRVEISSESHPFYTGTEKVIDTAGRVDKFKKRQAAAKQ